MTTSKLYPLSLTKDIQAMMTEVRKLQLENADVIVFAVQGPDQITLTDIDYPDEFSFTISNPFQDKDKKSLFNYNYKPKNANSLDENAGRTDSKTLLNLLNSWILLIKEYNQISFSEQDYIKAFYQKEFYTDFEIIEEDADINPIESNKQDMLYQRLLEFKQVLEDSNEKYDTQELIKDTDELIKELPTIPKKKVVKKLSEIYAKLRKKGTEAVKALGKELFSQAVKQIATHSIDYMTTVITSHNH